MNVRASIAASTFLCLGLTALPSAAQSPSLGQAACEKLASAKLAGGMVTSAQFVAAGALPPPPTRGGGPGGGAVANPFADVPAVCRVAATMKPSPDSNIKVEVWLPATTWNGKLRGTGNGGLGGGTAPPPNALAAGVRRGYVTVGSNTGHEGNSSYALEHPEQIKDFGYRSAHEMTVAAKALIRAFYGSGPKLSLMAESGGGTIAALSAAQRYPADYDGLAVVAMSSYLTRHTFGQMWVWQATHESDASFLTPDKYAALNQAALNTCDAGDGLKDGIIGDPEGCRVDLAALQCKGAAPAASCLTPPQVAAARKIYLGPRHSSTGAELYSALYPGSEPGWGQLAGGAEPLGIPVEFFKYYVLRDPAWDYKKRPINYDGDVTLSDRPEIQPVNAVDPDLRKYFARGGKLLLIGGWGDAAVPPKVAVNYYNRVVAASGEKAVRDNMRFFMVPGMGHGPGTTGPHNFSFDALTLIEEWKEKGTAPDQLIVSHFVDGKEVGKRLVCQYPQIARYKGSGDPETPGSYECRAR